MPAKATDRLESWKQIGSYLNRSVRTVRRWERLEGLPVHRHMHRSLGSVFAFRSEIDAWREQLARVPTAHRPSPDPIAKRIRTIAVLPFANLSSDVENAYLADGLTDELITALSKVPALRVTSRTSSVALRGTTQGAKAIARQLGVRYLLEGSVQRARARVRITVQLIDAANDVSLWGERYDSTMEEVLAIQERFTHQVAAALELHLTAEATRRVAQQTISSVPAYECYLRARYEGWRWNQASIDHSVRLLRQALELIGDNARLYAALGLAHLQYREAGVDLTERSLSEAERCAGKVFALDPGTAAGRQLRGWIQYSRGQIQEAVHYLKEAVALEPHNADSLLLLCNCYLISGRVSEARPLALHLLKVDPLTPITRCMPAFADIMEGQFAAAISPYRQMLVMDPANPMARLFYIWVLILNERRDEAAVVLAEYPPETGNSIPAEIARFLFHAAGGDAHLAQSVLSAQIELVAGAPDIFPRFLAQGFALLGMRAPALKWLKIAADRGFINYPFLARHDPSFRALRRDSEFRELLRLIRKRWAKFTV